MYQLRMGCQIVTLPKFTPDLMINSLRNEKASVLYVAPPIGKNYAQCLNINILFGTAIGKKELFIR